MLRLAIAMAVVLLSLGCGAGASRTASGSASIPCSVSLKFGKRWQSPPGQFHLNLVFVNNDVAACRLSGWPDVEF